MNSTSHGTLRLGGICIVLMLLFGATGTAVAGETSIEFWPEIDAWLRLSPTWRVSMFVPISKNIETAYREGNLILQADFAWGHRNHVYFKRLFDENTAQVMKTFLLRGGYLGARSLDDKGAVYNEDMAFLELHVRIPFVGHVLFSHRLRSDLRWIGDDNTFSTRWRYRMMIEKEYEVGITSLVPYINVEPYYDSRYKTINRVRLIGGASVSWAARFALEGNITYQYDSKSSVTNLYALNIIVHVFF